MDRDEHLNEVPSVGGCGSEAENSNAPNRDSLDNKENKLEDQKPCQAEEYANSLPEITLDKDLRVGFKLTESVVFSEEVRGEAVHAEHGCLSLQDGSPNGSPESDGRGAKRARITVDEHQPSVHFIYNSLTRASRQKLEELLQQWSEWHAKHVSSSDDPSEVLESGEETFFPALHVGHEKTSAVSFWIESQTRNDQNKDFIPLDDNSVPLYDRGYALGLTSADGSSNVDGMALKGPGRHPPYNLTDNTVVALRGYFSLMLIKGLGKGIIIKALKTVLGFFLFTSSGLEIIDAAARCFNCGSYNHSLRECQRPRDNVAVNNARKQHKSRWNLNASSRNPTRYYQNAPAGKYEGLRPGVLDDVTRQLLGLGELDPPPWLNRMREIGYPPGYLDVDEDQPSGITIYTDREIAEQEDGEIMEVDHPKPKRKITVEFPGINAPIPEKADERLWAAGAGPSSSDISRNRLQHRPNHSTDYGSRGHYREQRLGDSRDDDPPGDPGYSSSKYSFHPRFGSHDSVPRSSSMARFQLDWSRSPLHDEESPKPFSYHSIHYSTSERLLSPLDRDSGRLGSRTSENLYDRDRDLSSRFNDRSEDHHYRSWR